MTSGVFTVPEYNKIADDVDAPRIDRGLVISVHGIRTRGKWQREINVPLSEAGYLHELGDIDEIGFFDTPWPKTAARAASEIARLHERNRHRRLRTHAIGHSFGTIAIATAMKRNPDLKFDRIVMWGTTLKRAFPWRGFFDRGQVAAVLNETCWRDPAPYGAIFGCALHGGGCSGALGFKEADEQRIFNRAHEWTNHSHLGTPLHCIEAWIPFLRHGRPVK